MSELIKAVRTYLAGDVPLEVRWAADAANTSVDPMYAEAERRAKELKEKGITLEAFDKLLKENGLLNPED